MRVAFLCFSIFVFSGFSIFEFNADRVLVVTSVDSCRENKLILLILLLLLRTLAASSLFFRSVAAWAFLFGCGFGASFSFLS